MSSSVQFVGLILIPSIALVFLIFYVRATIEQAEAMQKPCVVLDSAPRDPQNAVMLQKQNPGDLVIASHGEYGVVALRNVGSGSALTVRYIFEKVKEHQGPVPRQEGAIQTIFSQDLVPTHVSAAIFPRCRFDCLITYVSLSKSHYETHFTVNDTVLSNFQFRRVSWWRRLICWYRERRYRRNVAAFKDIV